MPPDRKQPPNQPAQAKKETQIQFRVDAELYEAVTKAARPFGLSVIVRALLRAYIRGDVQLKQEDLLRELASATRGRKRRAGGQ